MDASEWVWMPHAGHFICGDRCAFHLTTYVGGYIVSTVGELRNNPSSMPPGQFEDIGYMRQYETMVFRAKRNLDPAFQCCHWIMDSPRECDFAAYDNASSATAGHYEMCRTWASPTHPTAAADRTEG